MSKTTVVVQRDTKVVTVDTVDCVLLSAVYTIWIARSKVETKHTKEGLITLYVSCVSLMRSPIT